MLNALTFSLLKEEAYSHPPTPQQQLLLCVVCHRCRGLCKKREQDLLALFPGSVPVPGAPGETSSGSRLAPRALSVRCKLSRQVDALCGVIWCQLTSSGMRPRTWGQRCFQSRHAPAALIGHDSSQAVCVYKFIPGACGEMELANACSFICPPLAGRLQGSLKQL